MKKKEYAMRQRFLIVAFVLSAILAVPVLAQTPNTCTDPYTPVACVFLPMLDQPAVTLITPTTAPPTATPTVQLTPAPPPALTIVSDQGYMRGSGAYIVGEVENTTNQPLYFVKIRARFYDAADVVIASEDGFTDLQAVFPQQRVPFAVVLAYASPYIVSYDLSIVSYNTTTVLPYVPVTVVTEQATVDTAIQVIGTVRNDNTKTVRVPDMAVTLYDSNGNVVDRGFGYADGTNIAYGQTTTYRITVYSTVSYDHFIVQAQSYLVP